jgi:hypothetical protein
MSEFGRLRVPIADDKLVTPPHFQAMEILIAQALRNDTCDETAIATLRSLDLESCGAIRSGERYVSSQGASTEADAGYQSKAGREFGIQKNGTVWINCPRERIPHGLAWLCISQTANDSAPAKLKLFLPELNLVDDEWQFDSTLRAILGTIPNGEIGAEYLQPATAETRAFFVSDDAKATVETFVAKLAKDSPQRKLAEAFLEGSEGSDE